MTFSSGFDVGGGGGGGGGSGNSTYDSLVAAVGLKAMTAWPPWNVGTTITPGSGEILAAATILTANVSYSKMYICTNGNASGLTLAALGVYNTVFGLVASTASNTALGTVAGWQSQSLQSTYTPTVTGLYYLASIYVGTTIPQVMEAGFFSNVAMSSDPTGGTVRMIWAQTGQAGLTNPATPTTIASTVIMGIS